MGTDSPTITTTKTPPRIAIVLTPTWHVDEAAAVRGLRALLKRLGRSYGWRVVSITPAEEEAG